MLGIHAFTILCYINAQGNVHSLDIGQLDIMLIHVTFLNQWYDQPPPLKQSWVYVYIDLFFLNSKGEKIVQIYWV
jgi:hypothetical protein